MKRLLSLFLLSVTLLTACTMTNPPIDGTTAATEDGTTATLEENETTTSEKIETTTPDDVDTTVPDISNPLVPTWEEEFVEYARQYGYESFSNFCAKSAGKSLHPVIGSVKDVYIGMSWSDFYKEIVFPVDFTIRLQDQTEKTRMYFWVDRDGKQVFTLIKDDSVCEIKVFEDLKDDVTKEEILLIKPGTHLYDVIEMAGFPRYYHTGNGPYYRFGSNKYVLIIDIETMTLAHNRPLSVQEYLNSQESTESTDLENSITEPASIN